jgi:hypothetical protein
LSQCLLRDHQVPDVRWIERTAEDAEFGGWSLEIGDWKLEVRRQLSPSIFQFLTSNF